MTASSTSGTGKVVAEVMRSHAAAWMDTAGVGGRARFGRVRHLPDAGHFRVTPDTGTDTTERTAKTEVRETLLGGRVLGGFVSTASLAAEMRVFLESCLRA